MSGVNEEMRRILEMVESGRISAAEGARLLESASHSSGSGTIRCPYCAERVEPANGFCPECRSNLNAGTPGRTPTAGGFGALTGLGKFLVLYTLLVTGFWLASLLFFGHGFFALSIPTLCGTALSILGLAAGIMILKGRPAGWTLGILWSALQIVVVIIGYEAINRQVFHLGADFNTNGSGFGINLVGIILLILFIKAKNDNNPEANVR